MNQAVPVPTDGGASDPHAEPTTPGLMMTTPLTTGLLFRRLRDVCSASRVVTVVDEDGTRVSATFATVAANAERLAAALARLGVRPGDRVASLAWNTQEHVEIYFAVMGMGAVLHTVNVRLFEEQIAYTIDHAADRVLIVDASLVGKVTPILPSLRSVEHVVVIGECDEPNGGPQVSTYADLLASSEPGFAWPELDENAGASLCYTSGTTGNPKGVLYSHRSIVLHALTMSGAGGLQIGRRDTALALVPLFHAIGWGLPFIVAVTGADLVLPGRHLDPASIARVVEEERVTWAGGVPTLWMDLLRHADERAAAGRPVDLSSLRLVLSGGTRVPVALMEAFAERFGVTLIQGWGMTETLPGATMSLDSDDADEETRWARRSYTGAVSPLYELRVVGPDGALLPHDGRSVGEVEVRGPIVAREYLGAGAPGSSFHEGWLRTGDMGWLSADGWLNITDRAKDAIKSGGEWISSMDLEAALMAHRDVHEAAVVGVPDPRWSERPAAYLVVAEGAAPTRRELRDHLGGLVAGWWIPDEFYVVAALPRTSTGKFDKKKLRAGSVPCVPLDAQ